MLYQIFLTPQEIAESPDNARAAILELLFVVEQKDQPNRVCLQEYLPDVHRVRDIYFCAAVILEARTVHYCAL